MIVTKLIGGLGNQMFQYAAGKSLALKKSVPLFVDTSFLHIDPVEKYTKRELELNQLNVELNIAKEDILQKFKSNRLKLVFNYLKRNAKYTIHSEPSKKFDPTFFGLNEPLYLNGFWQSELYFKDIRSILLKELSPNYSLTAKENELAKQIQSQQAVSIHVRRGDYVTNKNANTFHGLCSMDYYHTAISHIQKHTQEAVFFIFSDDLDWCRINFRDLKNCIFVETKSKYASLDLFLMSYCKHHIIANSSYSWWAAWLNSYEQKIVCAPKNWFSDSDTETDIYPTNWIKL